MTKINTTLSQTVLVLLTACTQPQPIVTTIAQPIPTIIAQPIPTEKPLPTATKIIPTDIPIPTATRQVSAYPLTINSCGSPTTFTATPQKAIAFDTNMTEIMLALDLGNKMVGYWISGVTISDKYKDQINKIPLISKETWPPPPMETILAYNPDFVFGGWGYNFSQESGVTPEKLATANVKSYILSESCISSENPKANKGDVSLDGTYQDIINIGKIFNVEIKATNVVNRIKSNIQNTQKAIGSPPTQLRGFYYGGGAETAFTTGKYGMASKLMDAVGTKNILRDIEKDWIPTQSWETIIKADPQFILIDDTPWESAKSRIETLESQPKLANITAIKQKKYIILPWRTIIPGVDMDEGVYLLAKALYPEKIK